MDGYILARELHSIGNDVAFGVIVFSGVFCMQQPVACVSKKIHSSK